MSKCMNIWCGRWLEKWYICQFTHHKSHSIHLTDDNTIIYPKMSGWVIIMHILMVLEFELVHRPKEIHRYFPDTAQFYSNVNTYKMHLIYLLPDVPSPPLPASPFRSSIISIYWSYKCFALPGYHFIDIVINFSAVPLNVSGNVLFAHPNHYRTKCTLYV